MRRSSLSIFASVLGILVLLAPCGCGKLFGDLKRDSRDSEDTEQDEAESSPPSKSWKTQSEPVQKPDFAEGVQKTPYKNGKRATRDDFVDQSQEEGSLWASSGQTNYYFTKNKIRSPGDIITLVLENDLYREIGIEIKNQLTDLEKLKEVTILRDQNRARLREALEPSRKDSILSSFAAPEKPTGKPNPPAAPASASAAGARAGSGAGTPAASEAAGAQSGLLATYQVPGEDIEKAVLKLSLADVNIYPSLEFKTGDTLMGEILERYPNGNYRVKGVKRIPYKNGTSKLVTVFGVVKSSDITEETDLLNSGKLYEYQVEVSA